MLPEPEGLIRSQVFPGLWLDAPAMLQGDLQRVLVTLQSGINSPEHQGFVQQLIARQQQQGMGKA